MSAERAAAEHATAETALLSLVREARVLVAVGAGGTGKTTVAAALALLGARAGRRTMVLTIDPARRLADSLGVAELDQQARELPRRLTDEAKIEPGLLSAMMLDQKLSFDEVVARHAPDEEAHRRILRNKLYRELSTRLAGGQEYAAMEKLYDLLSAAGHDLLVLDTPPTVNAIDFLEAPRKMVALLDGPAVRLFVKSYEQSGRLSLKLLSLGAAFVFKRLARFVGGAFLDDVAEFFGDMHALLPGFRQRAEELLRLLASDDVGFVIVAAPDERATEQAVVMRRRLRASGMHPAAVVVNRMHLLSGEAAPLQQVAAELGGVGIDADCAEPLAERLLAAHRRAAALAEADGLLLERLKHRCGDELPYLQVPLLSHDVHDIGGLSQLAEHLAGGAK